MRYKFCIFDDIEICLAVPRNIFCVLAEGYRPAVEWSFSLIDL